MKCYPFICASKLLYTHTNEWKWIISKQLIYIDMLKLFRTHQLARESLWQYWPGHICENKHFAWHFENRYNCTTEQIDANQHLNPFLTENLMISVKMTVAVDWWNYQYQYVNSKVWHIELQQLSQRCSKILSLTA